MSEVDERLERGIVLARTKVYPLSPRLYRGERGHTSLNHYRPAATQATASRAGGQVLARARPAELTSPSPIRHRPPRPDP